MSITPPPLGYERLLTPADLRGVDARLEALAQAPAEGVAMRVTRLGPIVTMTLDFRCPTTAWTSGNVLITLPDWARPWTTIYLPPPYSGTIATMIVDSAGAVKWYFNGTTPGIRYMGTWHTTQPMPA